MSRSLPFIIILFTTCYCSASILLHVNHQHDLQLESYYSTLGDRPSSLVSAPIILLNNSNVNDATCTLFNAGINQSINGSIIVYAAATLPPLFGCNNDPMGITAAFARVAQRMGAIGVITASVEKFVYGRVVGFTSSVSIPVLVMPMESIEVIVLNISEITGISLLPVSIEEDKLLDQLSTLFPVWAWTNTALYGGLILLLGYTILFDIYALRKTKRYFSHSSFLKWMSFASALCSFLWHVFDPFSFEGVMWWHSCILKSLMLGISVAVTMLVLRVWIQAITINTTHLLIWSVIIYGFVGVVLTTAFAYGIWWNNTFVVDAHLWSHMASIITSATGYIYFGGSIVAIMCRSGNASKNSKVLPTKIIIFIVFYALVTYSLVVVSFLILGGIIFCTLLDGSVMTAILSSIFAVLFYPQLARKKKSPRTSIKLKRETIQAASKDPIISTQV